MMPTWPAAPSTAMPLPPVYSYVPTPPAFIPVQARQKFGQYIPPSPFSSHAKQHYHGPPHQGEQGREQVTSHPPPPSPPHAAEVTSIPTESLKVRFEWPESVRRYVQRSFMPANLDPTTDRIEIETKLKAVISQARDTGTLLTIDWDQMTLPQVLIGTERDAELKRSHAGLPSHPIPPEVLHPALSKKRKSLEYPDDQKAPAQAPLAATNMQRMSLEERAQTQALVNRDSSSSPVPLKMSKFQKQSEKRQRRFEGGYKSEYQSSALVIPPVGPVVGTCQNLEKNYLRLTAPPVPALVRPESVLRKTLDLLKKKWRMENNYGYICDQFKSLRQDLTVQRIKNDFTVAVYEIHARIALEKADLGEYNQCQTQLRSLYAMGLKGNSTEFKAYRILYFIHTSNRTSLNEAMADLTPSENNEKPIRHALRVRTALALGNYHRFFQLYLDTPNMGAYLMDMFVNRERLAAMCNICKAYKPDVKLRFISEELGFESDAAAAEFLIEKGANHLLADRLGGIYFLTGKAGPYFELKKSLAFRTVDIKGQI